MHQHSSKTLPLLLELCAIPSWFSDEPGKECSEVAYATFVEKYLQEHAPALTVERIPMIGNPQRFSVLAKTPGDSVDLLVAVHLDTVEPSSFKNETGVWTNNFSSGDRFIGNDYLRLGASDNKGGAAALLTALAQSPALKNLAVYFYVAEETSFGGMKSFLAAAKDLPWRPKRVIIIEGTDLNIENSHRGCVEFKVRIFGESGHAAKADEGRSAMEAFLKAFSTFSIAIAKQSARAIEEGRAAQPTSVNIAGITCGQVVPEALDVEGYYSTEKLIPVKVVPNKKADIVEIIFDIRPGVIDTPAKELLTSFQEHVAATGCTCELVGDIVHNLVGMRTDPAHFSDLARTIERATGYAPQFTYMSGYGEGAMITTQLNVPTVYFGPTGGKWHKHDEYVSIASLDQVAAVFTAFFSEMAQ